MITMFGLFFISDSLTVCVDGSNTVENEEKHTSRYCNNAQT